MSRCGAEFSPASITSEIDLRDVTQAAGRKPFIACGGIVRLPSSSAVDLKYNCSGNGRFHMPIGKGSRATSKLANRSALPPIVEHR